ncbi:MAG: GNAT family protein [Patescibacteria group bacterium]|nr:GNAT family protein [Patescibacteria group bacterium]
MPKFKNKIVGKRIVLKLNKPSILMAQKMFEVIIDNRQHLRPWFPWEKSTKKVEDSLKFLFATEEKINQGKAADYGIYLQDKYVGSIGIFDLDKEKKSGEIGYWLSAKFVRKGYMSEAVGLLEKEFFTNNNLNRIQIKCDEKNVASMGVAKKCGYSLEGKFRENCYSEHFKNFRNTLIFSKLKAEFKKKNK